MFGKNWNQIQKFIATRSCPQTRSHAQKFFRKMQKQGLLLGFGSSIDNEGVVSPGSDSDVEKRKGIRKRARVNSLKPPAERIKEKILNGGTAA